MFLSNASSHPLTLNQVFPHFLRLNHAHVLASGGNLAKHFCCNEEKAYAGKAAPQSITISCITKQWHLTFDCASEESEAISTTCSVNFATQACFFQMLALTHFHEPGLPPLSKNQSCTCTCFWWETLPNISAVMKRKHMQERQPPKVSPYLALPSIGI